MTFQAAEGFGVLLLKRGTAVLLSREVHLPGGPVRVSIERDGDRFRVQVNDLLQIEYWELAPPRPGEGTFGILWPAGVPLTRLRADTLPLPPTPSQLERADDLFALGRFADALPLYEDQARTGGPAAAEARCKAGLCLLELGRPDEAIQTLEPLAAAPGERWPAVAGVYLWLAHLRQNRFEDAQAAVTYLAGRFPRDVLARLVPESVRAEILGRQHHLPPLGYFHPTPDLVRQVKARMLLAEILESDYMVSRHHYTLGIAHALLGENGPAAEEFRRLVSRPIDRSNLGAAAHDLPWASRWFSWVVSRRRGGVEGIRTELREATGRLFTLIDANPGALNSWALASAHGVKVALARAEALAGNWTEAEAIVDRLLAEPAFTGHTRYVFFGEAWLIKGFCLEHRKDPEGAVAAWKKGTRRAFLAARPPDRGGFPRAGYDIYTALLTGSLSGDLTDEEALELFGMAVAAAGDDPLFTNIPQLLNMSPTVVRGMFRSPRGKELARQMVFLDMAPADYFVTPLRCLGYEKFRQDLFAGKPTPEQDEVTWQCVVGVSDAFLGGRFEKGVLLQAGVAWAAGTGGTGTFGWAGLAKVLPADLRPGVAYLMGLRYVRKNRPGDAKGMLATAEREAPADSPLKKLAREELDKLEKKK